MFRKLEKNRRSYLLKLSILFSIIHLVDSYWKLQLRCFYFGHPFTHSLLKNEKITPSNVILE